MSEAISEGRIALACVLIKTRSLVIVVIITTVALRVWLLLRATGWARCYLGVTNLSSEIRGAGH